MEEGVGVGKGGRPELNYLPPHTVYWDLKFFAVVSQSFQAKNIGIIGHEISIFFYMYFPQ